MFRRRILAAAALLVATSPAAHALDLFTPSSQAPSGSYMRCVLTNVGTKPLFVSATIVDESGNSINNGNHCYPSPWTLDPGKSCIDDTDFAGHQGYCHFTTTSSKVRGSLLVFGTGGVVTSSLAASK